MIAFWVDWLMITEALPCPAIVAAPPTTVPPSGPAAAGVPTDANTTVAIRSSKLRRSGGRGCISMLHASACKPAPHFFRGVWLAPGQCMRALRLCDLCHGIIDHPKRNSILKTESTLRNLSNIAAKCKLERAKPQMRESSRQAGVSAGECRRLCKRDDRLLAMRSNRPGSGASDSGVSAQAAAFASEAALSARQDYQCCAHCGSPHVNV